MKISYSTNFCESPLELIIGSCVCLVGFGHYEEVFLKNPYVPLKVTLVRICHKKIMFPSTPSSFNFHPVCATPVRSVHFIELPLSHRKLSNCP